MDEEKLCRAVDWLRSVLTHENLAPIEKFELSDIGQHHYRLSFEMNGVEKVFPMAAIYVEGIADGYERIQAQIKPLLLDPAKVADRYIRGRLSSAGLALLRRGRCRSPRKVLRFSFCVGGQPGPGVGWGAI
jgi:hypothetical protein